MLKALRLLFLILALGIFSSQGYSQRSSSQERMERIQSMEEGVRLLNKADGSYAQDPDAALDMLEKALYYSLENDILPMQADCYTVLGKVNQHLSQFDLAEGKYRQALAKYEKPLEKSELIVQERKKMKAPRMGSFKSLQAYDTLYPIHEIKWLLALSVQEQERWDEVLILYDELEQDAENRRDLQRKSEIQTKIAEVYQRKGEPVQALDYSGRALNSAQTEGNFRNYDAEIIYGASNSLLGNEGIADTVLKNAQFNIATDSITPPEVLAESRSKLASYYDATGRKEEEIAQREDNLKFFDEMGIEDEAIEEKVKLSDAYLEVGDANKAIVSLEGLDQIDSTLPLPNQAQVYRNYAHAYELNGETEKALGAYQKWAEITDSIQPQMAQNGLASNQKPNSSISDRLQRIESIENEMRISEQTIVLLEQAQEIREQEIFNQRVIIFSLIGGLLILSLAFYRINRESVKKRKANQMLALKSLRSQMNPHFIFNALNSVNGYISRNEERKANKYLSEFSRLMRLVLENSKQELVPLKDELELLALYLKLEHSRFEDRFEYQLEVDENLNPDQYDIPPMLVQPFVENAVWHGLRYLEGEPGELKVHFSMADKDLKVIIEDNGIGRQKSQQLKTKNQQKSQSTGLRNTENRIKLINRLYQTDYDILIEDLHPDQENTGTRVSLTIPAKNLIHA
ncbi:histidine kinase [bacterium SCSIO 12741]|nr:histidine kinase [bacterium SCSIO 12741]